MQELPLVNGCLHLEQSYEGVWNSLTDHDEKRNSQLTIICGGINSASGLRRPGVYHSFVVFLFLGHIAVSQHGRQRAERDVKTKSNQMS